MISDKFFSVYNFLSCLRVLCGVFYEAGVNCACAARARELCASFYCTLQTTAMGRDHVPIPVERFLAVPRERSRPVVISVDVDEAVTLAHLRGRRAHEVDAAPRRIAHDGHAVGDGLLHLHEMVVQIVDAVVVLHRHAARAVRDEHVLCAQPVLHDEERLLPAVIEAVQHGVDLVERQPVFYLLPIARKDRAHVPLVEADEVMTHPAVVCFGKVERRLVVRDRDERLDAVSQENTSLTVLLYPCDDQIDAYKKMRHKRIHDTGLALGNCFD